jgi:hypothetical protein
VNDDELRRLLPPPRRRPNPIEVGVRWRVELLLLAAVGMAVHRFGGWIPLGVAGVLTVLLAVSREARHVALGLLHSVVVPHRVRSGLVQAGVADRSGRLPWLVSGRPRGDDVVVTVWLRSGTSIHDLEQASELLATSCGASRVELERYSAREDRVRLVVVRPRWGWWTD